MYTSANLPIEPDYVPLLEPDKQAREFVSFWPNRGKANATYNSKAVDAMQIGRLHGLILGDLIQV